jgi:GntR family transcriptional regulator
MVDFSLDKKSPVPFYRQIVDLILAGISSGTISPGDKLPTIREMSVKLEINPNTVVRAYSQLQMLGVLDTQQGSGVFVSARPGRSRSETDKQRTIDVLCRDFVGRAQLLDISVRELIEHLRRM